MKFEEALKELRAGCRIRCDHWDDNDFIRLVGDSVVNETGDDAGCIDFQSLIDDIWEVKNDCLDFADAFEAMREGKRVRRKGWVKNYIHILHGAIGNCNHEAYHLSVEDYLAEDFQIVN